MSLESGKNSSLFSIFSPQSGGWFFVYLLGGMLFMRSDMFLWDGGTCRHIINGEYYLAHHSMPANNYTSAIFQLRSLFDPLLAGRRNERALFSANSP